MKRIITAVLVAFITCNSLFFTVVSGSSAETAISIETVSADTANQTVTIAGQINNPVENQQVTLMIYTDSDYKNTDNILFIDQISAELDSDSKFTIIFPCDIDIDEDTLTLRMGGSNVKTPVTFDFNLSNADTKYNDFFENGDASDYTIIDNYITGGITAGMTAADLGLADDVKVYNDNGSTEVTGKLGTGMIIKKEDILVTIVIKGDVTGSGYPGIRDVRSFLNYTMNGAEFNKAQELAVAEYLENGKNIEAVKQLVEYIVGNR